MLLKHYVSPLTTMLRSQSLLLSVLVLLPACCLGECLVRSLLSCLAMSCNMQCDLGRAQASGLLRQAEGMSFPVLPMVLYASLLPLHPVMQISKQVRRLDGVRQAQEDMYEAPGPRAMSVVSAVLASVNAVP